jgi:two-component system, cell cycle sensor histidine kinase and response regulator CckA
MERPDGAIRISDDLHALLDASPDAVIAVDGAGRIVYANARVADTFGFVAEELRGEPVERLLPERFAGVHAGHREGYLGRPIARPMGIGLDLAGRHRDGHEFPVEISLAPLETSAGRLVFATVVDISARKSLELQLLQAQKMESVGRLAGGIAHDFNNMLFAVRSYADMLADDLRAASQGTVEPLELMPAVEGIVTATEQAAALTGQLLAFSRQQVLRPEVREVNAAVRHVEPMLRRLIGEHVRLVLDLDPDTGTARLDASQLDQVLMNLVVNARDAMPDGGVVTIASRNAVFDEAYAVEHFDVQPGAYVMLSVTDTGQGMDRETRQHVFEPFFTTKDAGKGTGLGLATVFGIVRQAGGHIWLYSEPGLGTTFKIYFPRVEFDVPIERRSVERPPDERRGTVLLVEDEVTVRDAARLVLQRAGFTVLAPDDPREALDLLEARLAPIDALVTDVVMPGLSGRELARRAMVARPNLGVVLLSGYTPETTDVADLLGRGARYASKPLPPRDLVQLVESVMTDRMADRSRGGGDRVS